MKRPLHVLIHADSVLMIDAKSQSSWVALDNHSLSPVASKMAMAMSVSKGGCERSR